jgi:galacturonosyltransferase
MHQISHCTIHPTYYPEGLSNVLLESLACSRPIITTNRSGCKEIVDDGINGFVIRQQDTQDLINKIEKFLSMSYEEKKELGLNGRKKVEGKFSRKIVVDKYIQELNIQNK